MNLAIPIVLRNNIRFLLGGDTAGDSWLCEASQLAGRLACSWGVEPVRILEGGAMSLCIQCVGAEGLLVLKVPSSADLGRDEAAALEAWGGGMSPRVVESDRTSGSFLMEFVPPSGTPNGPAAIKQLLARLHVDPAGLPFDGLEASLGDRLGGAESRFAAAGFEKERDDVAAAGQLLAALDRSTTVPTLVHGDFQAKNVLPGRGGPVAIDPLPAIGDPLFDAALWIAGGSAGPRATALQQFTEPGADAPRLLAWTWALTVIEYRPGKGAYADAVSFINRYRHEAMAAVAVLAA